MSKTVAIVQARMGSGRLPGKVLEKIQDRTMLEHVVRRLQMTGVLDDVIVATSRKPTDDAIEALCRAEGLSFYRGHEDDVLSRYLEAAEEFGATEIVRVCADSPFVDPQVSRGLIAEFVQNLSQFDYGCNHVPLTYPLGLNTEIFTIEALRRTHENATEFYHRSHVTLYMVERPEEFRTLKQAAPGEFGHHRWTVDTPEDLAFARAVFEAVGDSSFTWRDVLHVLENNPALTSINQHVSQKDVRLG